jgi:hypothetical protein
MNAMPTPTIVSFGFAKLGPETIYLVLDDFGIFGRAYRETDICKSDRNSIIANLITGQYERPLRIIAFNTSAGFACDVTGEIAGEIEARLCATEVDEIAPGLRAFLDRASPAKTQAESCGSGRHPAMAEAGFPGAQDNP